MPSPFPGMDPWLEKPSEWNGFHQAYVVAMQAELNRVLPPGYRAKIDEYVWVRDQADDEEHRMYRPDVLVPEPVPTSNRSVGVVSRTITLPDLRGRLAAGRRKKVRHVAIVDSNRQVWTVIELLSPANKSSGDDREAYVRKRKEFLASVNLIEIDLLRSGERMPTGDVPLPDCDYLVVSCRAMGFPEFEAWTLDVRDPLPVLPVPFGEDTEICPLDLRACLDRVYDETRADIGIDYSVPPVPRLRKPDAQWAREWLAKFAKKRKK